VLNDTRRYKDVCRGGGISPHILNPRDRWKWMVSSAPGSLPSSSPLHLGKRALGTYCLRSCVESETIWNLGRNFYPFGLSNHDSSGLQLLARSWVGEVLLMVIMHVASFVYQTQW